MTTHLDAIPAGSTVDALPVLMYHSISAHGGKLRDLGVPPETLRAHLSALTAAGYRLVGLSTALDLAHTGDPLVALTFDDAYLDFLTHAVPVLAEANAAATLYVPAASVGARAGWLGAHADAFGPLLTWSQLHEVVGAGMEIGNHGLRHEPLDVLAAGDAARQIAISRDRLTQRMQVPIRSFCYPHGYHSRKVRAAVAWSGHDNACEIGRRLCRPDDDRFAVPRLQPTPNLDGDQLLRMVRTAGTPLTSTLKHLAGPGWRLTRLITYRTMGVMLT